MEYVTRTDLKMIMVLRHKKQTKTATKQHPVLGDRWTYQQVLRNLKANNFRIAYEYAEFSKSTLNYRAIVAEKWVDDTLEVYEVRFSPDTRKHKETINKKFVKEM